MRPLRVIVFATAIIAMMPAVAKDIPAAVSKVLPGAATRGEATLRFMGFKVYDAALFTAGGGAFNWDAPMALQLRYAMSFDKGELIETTRDELERMEGAQPDHAEIEAKLDACFRAVDKGDNFIAAREGADAVSLWFNGAQTCMLTHPGIAKRFLSIWLSDQSQSARLSRQLRGE